MVYEGKFIVKEAYMIETGYQNIPKPKIWKWIWQHNLWPKVSILLWLLNHNKILLGIKVTNEASQDHQYAFFTSLRKNPSIIFLTPSPL